MKSEMMLFEMSLPLPLPKVVLDLVYCFDPTRRENYDNVIEEINNYQTNALVAEKYIFKHDAMLMDWWYDIGSSNWYWYWKKGWHNNPYCSMSLPGIVPQRENWRKRNKRWEHGFE